MTLFREQVIHARRKRLYGEVLIASPVRFWIITVFLVSIIVALVLFLATASFARIETVRGAIVPSKGVVHVRAPSGGVLTDFLVTEGQFLSAGRVVGRVTASTAANYDGTRIDAELKRIADNISQIDAQIAQSAAVAGLTMAAKERERAELSAQIAGSRSMLSLQTAMLEETKKNADRMFKLSKLKLANAEALSQRNMGLIEAQQEVQRLKSDIRLLELRRDRLVLDQEQALAQARLEELRLKAEKMRLASERRIITSSQAFDLIAPITGTATAVLSSNGFDLTAGRQIFSILPEGGELEVELYVPSRAVGFVERGQKVSLLFDAFPYQRFGAQSGRVSEVASSVISPGGADLLVQPAEPVYRVKVSLDADTVQTGRGRYPLQAGMLLNANIVLEDRTIFAWLLEPLLSVARRS